MDSFIEEEKILTFGNKSFDISNVAYGRIEYAIKEWNKALNIEGFTESDINNMCERVGLYMIRQDFDVLRLRLSFFDSVKSFIKRYMLTIKHIKKSNKQEYEEFQDWVYFTLTGNKKKDLETDTAIMETARKIYRDMEKQGINQEQCSELLQTLLAEQVKELQTYTKDHNQS
ncbi:MAG: hypothetical protein GY928_21330 [Colwellia sp.]|nr:hypothetical protein [Colwellia sp.]